MAIDSSNLNGHHRHASSVSQSQRSINDGNNSSPISRHTSGKVTRSHHVSSVSSTHMSETVNLLKRRCADELGSATASNILSSCTRLLEWISAERLRRWPTEGSAWDKVLAWAQAFAEKFNDFDQAIEDITGGNYDGAEIAFGYCILLLELGEDNASALQTSFGFFFQRSLDLIVLLDRAELFSASAEIIEQLTLAYADLVTLVSDVALRFYQSIRGANEAEVAVDIYTTFGTTIQSFGSRRDRIVESMWSYRLKQESVDTTRTVSIKTLRSWLSVSDSVLKYKTGDHTNLVAERQQLTCLWLQPYLTRFLNSNRDSLVVTGGAGSGKSVLAGTIVDTLQKVATRKSYNVIFVPIDTRIKAYATGIHVASQLLSQLLETRVGNVQLYRSFVEAFHDCQKTRDIHAYESRLWKAVEDVIENSLTGVKETILVVDGLDEVSDDSKEGQTLLKRLKDASSKHESVRLIAIAQPSVLAPNTKPDVEITDDISFDDISVVVSNLLTRSPHFTSRQPIEQDILVDQIVSASKGSFLWAKLVTKSLVMENSQEKLTKAVEALKRSPKPTQDVIKEFLTQPNVTNEGRMSIYWLTVSERPLTVEELSCLYTADPKRGTTEQPFDPIRALQPLATLVFLQNGLLYLRHRIIRQTLATWFEQNKPIKEPGFDFVLRLLTYIKSTIREQRDPSFTTIDSSQTSQRFEQNPLIEYAIRYWPQHYQSLPTKIRDDSSEFKKELSSVTPTSPIVALIEKDTWTWVPAPTKIAWHTTSIDLRRKVLNTDHPIVLQSIINLATIFQTIEDYQSAANYYYTGIQSSTRIFSRTHPLTIQCTNYFLEVTNNIKYTSRTEIVTRREEILITLIETYKKIYGGSSEQVTSLRTQLIQLYRSVKEEQKVTELEKYTKETTTQDGVEGGTRTGTGSLGVRVRSRRIKDYDYDEWSFRETEHDSVIEIEVWKHVQELLRLAAEYSSKSETAKAEQCYIEAWYHVSTQTKSTTTIETHVKKIDLAITYTNFLKSVKRENEASALLTGVWEEYRSLSISRTEAINTKLIEVSKVLLSLHQTSVALSIFKHCASVYRSLNKTESSTYKEVQELEKTTHKEIMKQASSSSSSASNLSEESITEIFTYMQSSKSTQIDETSVSAIRKVVSSYIAQHRYKEATVVIKKTLRTIWSSLFSASIEDVSQPINNPDLAIELLEQLIVSYRSRHRPGKALEYRERLYRSLKLSRKIDDKLVQHNVTELFKIYEQLRLSDKIIQLYRELLEDYKKFHGANHPEVVKVLFTLARLTTPEPVSVEYYRQIVNILSKDSDTCHPDAIEPLRLVAAHYWNERRYPGAVWAYSLLFRTFTLKGKEYKPFQDTAFVSTIYNRYVESLRATTTEIGTIYQISIKYRTTCTQVFGLTSKTTIEATLYLARICENSKRYQTEAITLYEQLLKESVASEYHAEIRQTLEAIYEEQSLEAARSTNITASTEQLDRAITVIRQRTSTNRTQYGWAHQESLDQLKEITHLLVKQSKKEEAHKELNEATRQIITKETSSASLIRSAETIASSYIAMNETHRGIEIAEEMRWQLVTKDSSNSSKYNFDLTKSSRSSAIFIAQLEYNLRQDSSTSFNEIYLSILTEIVYYEEFQRSIRSNLSIEVVFAIAARLYQFLSLHQRLTMRSHVESELVSFFLRSSGEKAKVGDVAQVKVLVITLLNYITDHEVKDFQRSVNLASIDRVRVLLRQGQQKQACDLAQTAFRYNYAVGGYKTHNSIIYGLILAITIADVDNKQSGSRQGQTQIAAEIIRQLLRSAQELKLNLAGVPVHQINLFITILGEVKDYETLEWFLSILWEARETHRAWKPAVVLELGYRLVLALFLLGNYDVAVKLASDIAYNLRRVYGATHLATLEVNVLLSQLYVSTGLAFQGQKGAEEIARRYYKRAITVHENVLRSLTVDPLGLGGDEDDFTVLSTEPEPMDLSVVVDKDASQGVYARKHLQLLKLALERYGGYPKGLGEYEAINADVFRSYPDECRGFEGVEKWSPEKFGAGKATSNDGCLDTNKQQWSLSSSSTAGQQLAHTNGKAQSGKWRSD